MPEDLEVKHQESQFGTYFQLPHKKMCVCLCVDREHEPEEMKGKSGKY